MSRGCRTPGGRDSRDGAQGMWKRMTVAGLTGAAWATTILDAMNMLPPAYNADVDRVVIAAALAWTLRLYLWSHDRPIGKAYELGYERGCEKGHRDAMREFNTKVTPLRPAGRGEFHPRRRVSPPVDMDA